MATATASGLQTAVLLTPHLLVTHTEPGAYQLHVDVSAMDESDAATLDVEIRVTSGGQWRKAYSANLSDAQDLAASISPVVVSVYGVRAILTQTEGTPRSFPWTLVQV